MAWGAIAASVIGGMMASDASRSASGAQVGASRDATAAQERMFNKQVELQEPFRAGGLAANNRLLYLLGLSPNGTGNQSGMTAQSLRAQLLPSFTKTTQPDWNPFETAADGSGGVLWNKPPAAVSTVDEAGLNSAIQQRMDQQAMQQKAASGDPEYGSLMRSFGMQDFQADPGYAFRQSEGMKGVENSAAARGGLLSGAALKAIQKYGQDLASQEYGNAYQRFNADQTNKYNRLAGIVNTGQGATNQVGNAAANFGNAQANNIIGAGNAQAAGMVGSANAMNSAIGQGTSLYQQNQLMDLIRNPRNNYYNAGGSGAYTRYGSQQTQMLNDQWN